MAERWIGNLQFMETWLSLLTAIFSAVSLLIVWKGYVLAKDYLGQHKKKIELERRRFAAEGALRGLIEYDRNISFCFSDLRIRNIDSFKEKLNQINQETSVDILVGKDYKRDIRTVQLRFVYQVESYHQEIYKPHVDIMYYGDLMKDSRFEELQRNFDHDVRVLMRYISQDLSFLTEEQWEDLKDKFPLSLSDIGKPIIQEYDKSAFALKDLFLSYC